MTTETSKANDENTILKKMCLLGFESEMALAGETPPKGMAEYTCNCFIKKASIGFSIETSREECKKETSKKFNL